MTTSMEIKINVRFGSDFQQDLWSDCLKQTIAVMADIIESKHKKNEVAYTIIEDVKS